MKIMKRKQSNKYDIVVGIPSYNESDTIPYVTKTVGEGLAEYFPDKKSIIVNVDNNSPDNTKEAFLDTKTRIEKKYIDLIHSSQPCSNLFATIVPNKLEQLWQTNWNKATPQPFG